ncbi:MAG: glycine zipper family protein [Ruminococcaceae bacterium]|nr:glycine zipper family protein [Oscillospiraceae bacterium]
MKSKKEPDDQVFYLPICMSIGLSIGTAIGAAFQNIAIGMSVGLSIGVGVGAVIDYCKRKSSEESSTSNEDEKE